MGLSLFGRSSSSYESCSSSSQLPNPNPKNYIVAGISYVKMNLVLEIKYPDCTNYEGNKILVYRNTTFSQLQRQGSIDPHFCNNPCMISPFARFEPTTRGKEAALKLAKII